MANDLTKSEKLLQIKDINQNRHREIASELLLEMKVFPIVSLSLNLFIKYVYPLYCHAEVYAGRVVCYPLVSHGEYYDRTDRPKDRRTDARPLHYAFR